MANYHVVKNPQGGWDAKKEGGQKASAHLDTQKEAEQKAKELAGNSRGGEVRIHSVKGPIRDSDTVVPGNDPNLPKDKKH
jgi:hypothetical protein